MTLPESLKTFELDHLGIAVNNLNEGVRFYQALGFQSMTTEVVESEKVKVGLLELTNNSRIELLEPTSEESPIAKFLKKRGPGLHHVCLRVKNIRGLLKDLAAANIQLIDSVPKLGAHQCLVAFIHPRSTGGVLIELSEKQVEVHR